MCWKRSNRRNFSWKGKSTTFLAHGSEAGNDGRICAIILITARWRSATSGYLHLRWSQEEYCGNQSWWFSNSHYANISRGSKHFLWAAWIDLIDGCHLFEFVAQDLALWYSRLIEGGVTAFPDTLTWGPRTLVKERCTNRRTSRMLGLLERLLMARECVGILWFIDWKTGTFFC